jgi:hypothetical protein
MKFENGWSDLSLGLHAILSRSAAPAAVSLISLVYELSNDNACRELLYSNVVSLLEEHLDGYAMHLEQFQGLNLLKQYVEIWKKFSLSLLDLQSVFFLLEKKEARRREGEVHRSPFHATALHQLHLRSLSSVPTKTISMIAVLSFHKRVYCVCRKRLLAALWDALASDGDGESICGEVMASIRALAAPLHEPKWEETLKVIQSYLTTMTTKATVVTDSTNPPEFAEFYVEDVVFPYMQQSKLKQDTLAASYFATLQQNVSPLHVSDHDNNDNTTTTNNNTNNNNNSSSVPNHTAYDGEAQTRQWMEYIPTYLEWLSQSIEKAEKECTLLLQSVDCTECLSRSMVICCVTERLPLLLQCVKTTLPATIQVDQSHESEQVCHKDKVNAVRFLRMVCNFIVRAGTPGPKLALGQLVEMFVFEEMGQAVEDMLQSMSDINDRESDTAVDTIDGLEYQQQLEKILTLLHRLLDMVDEVFDGDSTLKGSVKTGCSNLLRTYPFLLEVLQYVLHHLQLKGQWNQGEATDGIPAVGQNKKTDGNGVDRDRTMTMRGDLLVINNTAMLLNMTDQLPCFLRDWQQRLVLRASLQLGASLGQEQSLLEYWHMVDSSLANPLDEKSPPSFFPSLVDAQTAATNELSIVCRRSGLLLRECAKGAELWNKYQERSHQIATGTKRSSQSKSKSTPPSFQWQCTVLPHSLWMGNVPNTLPLAAAPFAIMKERQQFSTWYAEQDKSSQRKLLFLTSLDYVVLEAERGSFQHYPHLQIRCNAWQAAILLCLSEYEESDKLEEEEEEVWPATSVSSSYPARGLSYRYLSQCLFVGDTDGATHQVLQLHLTGLMEAGLVSYNEVTDRLDLVRSWKSSDCVRSSGGALFICDCGELLWRQQLQKKARSAMMQSQGVALEQNDKEKVEKVEVAKKSPWRHYEGMYGDVPSGVTQVLPTSADRHHAKIAEDFESQRWKVRSALVRIMKLHRRLEDSRLIEECIECCKPWFTPSADVLANCIESLVEMEYLERRSRNAKELIYVP